jgi:hypothetical protein
MAWFNTVEFYVISGAIAAAVVALSALPSKRGAAILHMSAGELSPGTPTDSPQLQVTVDDNRRVHIHRTGLNDITDAGACSLAINVIGFDIEIEERHVPGRGFEQMHDVDFVLDFLAPDRYHIKYNSEDDGAFAAFTLPVREGIRISKSLRET